MLNFCVIEDTVFELLIIHVIMGIVAILLNLKKKVRSILPSQQLVVIQIFIIDMKDKIFF